MDTIAKVMLTWHIKDEAACPICKALNGYTWEYEIGKDQFGNFLISPYTGQVVWDVHRGSKAHGHIGANCRCSIESQFELGSLLERLKRIRNRLEAGVAEGNARGDMVR